MNVLDGAFEIKIHRRGGKQMGKVYLVGAGPGDIDLITVKGVKCIEQADVILYDRLINKELLQYAKDGVELIYCGKLPDYHTLKQETINRFLVKHALKGKVVTRLKGGILLYMVEEEKKLKLFQTMVSHLKLYRVLPRVLLRQHTQVYQLRIVN